MDAVWGKGWMLRVQWWALIREELPLGEGKAVHVMGEVVNEGDEVGEGEWEEEFEEEVEECEEEEEM